MLRRRCNTAAFAAAAGPVMTSSSPHPKFVGAQTPFGVSGLRATKPRLAPSKVTKPTFRGAAATPAPAVYPPSPETFPRSFSGDVIWRPTDNIESETWRAHNYSYATSSYKRAMNPICIAYARTLDDVKAVVKYANEKGVAVAVRSGSHSYMGACSTTGDNIQLDLSGQDYSSGHKWSQPLKDSPWKKLDIDEGTGLVQVGPGVPLGFLAAELVKHQLWSPFGECSPVNTGGHCQSGGISVVAPAMAGCLVDNVQAYDVVLANGELVTVHRKEIDNVGDNVLTQQQRCDLFYALGGSSPGSYGIVTKVTIQCRFDRDWDFIDFSVAGNQNLGIYDRAQAERLCTLWAKVVDQDALPEEERLLPKGSSFYMIFQNMGTGAAASNPKNDSVDDYAVRQYEGGKYFARNEVELQAMDPPQTSRKITEDVFHEMAVHLTIVTVNCTVFIDKKTMSPEEITNRHAKAKAFFQLLNDTCAWTPLNKAINFLQFAMGLKRDLEDVVRHLLPDDHSKHKKFDSKAQTAPKTLSQLLAHGCGPYERQYLRAFEEPMTWGAKDFETGETIQLYDPETKKSKFAQVLIGDLDKMLVKPLSSVAYVGLQLTGPHYTKYTDGRAFWPPAAQPGLCSWGAFWDEQEKRQARDYIDGLTAKLTGKNGLFCRRPMTNIGLAWGPRNIDAPETRMNYWHTPAIYERLLNIKRKVDPNWTFTANEFGIGASQRTFSTEPKLKLLPPPAEPFEASMLAKGLVLCAIIAAFSILKGQN